MKKIILTLAITTLLALTSTRGAITSALLSFNDNNVDGNGIATTWTSNVGTFNFSVSVFLTFASDGSNPNMLQGLSYWLETETGAASHITLTSLVYFTITQPTDPSMNKVFNASSGADPGFLASHDSQTAKMSSPKLNVQLLNGSGLRLTAARVLAFVPCEVSATPQASSAAPQRQAAPAPPAAAYARKAAAGGRMNV